MAVIINKPIQTISVLTILFTLQIFYFYVADAQSNILNTIIPNCIFGVDSLSYILYTREFPHGKRIYINDTNWPNPGNKVVFLVHGFISLANTTNNYELVTAMLNKEDVSIFGLDWKDASCNSGLSITDLLAYNSAINNVPTVGEDMANFTMRLVQYYGLSLNTTTFIGHSLGAHVVSYACKSIQKNLNQKPFQVIALDPAGIGFENRQCSERLCKEDAIFVQVFHTSSSAGFSAPIGHDDFYFNGGMTQPGCFLPSCSHSRATMYLTATVQNERCIGTPWKYKSHNIMPTKECTPNLCSTPGFTAQEQKPRGTFYVRTNSSDPYC